MDWKSQTRTIENDKSEKEEREEEGKQTESEIRPLRSSTLSLQSLSFKWNSPSTSSEGPVIQWGPGPPSLKKEEKKRKKRK